MRILHVTPFYEPYWAYGGMARGSVGLCRALARRGHEVTVATALLAPGPALEESSGGVRVRRFRSPSVLNRLLVPGGRGFRGFLERELPSIDAVHLHGHRNFLAVTAARALRAAGRSWVLQTSGTFPHHGQYRAMKALFDRLAGDRVVAGASVLVAVSQAEARDLPRPARVVPNGVEPSGSAPGDVMIQDLTPRVLFVGTDRWQKRGGLLPGLLDALPGVELHLVGRFDRWFLETFRRFGPRVTVRGVLTGDALAAAYATAHVVVHPAVGEAFGLVPFEAALAGTAAVVAGGHGCGEWFRAAGGSVVPPDDLPALADAVRALLTDRVRARAEADAVAAFARERLTWDAAARAMEEIYRESGAGPA